MLAKGPMGAALTYTRAKGNADNNKKDQMKENSAPKKLWLELVHQWATMGTIRTHQPCVSGNSARLHLLGFTRTQSELVRVGGKNRTASPSPLSDRTRIWLPERGRRAVPASQFHDEYKMYLRASSKQVQTRPRGAAHLG